MSKSNSEVGHIKNLENFYDLIQFCIRFEASYNPAAPHLTIPSIQAKYEESKELQDIVNDTFSNSTHKINDRQKLFEQLPKRTTRVIQYLTASTNDKKIIADARRFSNKIHGNPSKPETKDNQEGQETNQPRSNSQRSFDKMMEHFENLILLLEKEPLYTPNETDLSVAGLRTFLTELNDADKAYTASLVPYKKALTNRDESMYDEPSGLVPLANNVKTYIKSVFGIKSLEYKEISKIKFKMFKR